MHAGQQVGGVRDGHHDALVDVEGPWSRGGSAGRVADACTAPWHGRPDLVTAALVLLERQGLVLVAAGSTRAWKTPPPGG